MGNDMIDEIPEDGNGKAVFIEYGTEEEFKDFERDQQPMWKKFYDKVSKL